MTTGERPLEQQGSSHPESQSRFSHGIMIKGTHSETSVPACLPAAHCVALNKCWPLSEPEEGHHLSSGITTDFQLE